MSVSEVSVEERGRDSDPTRLEKKKPLPKSINIEESILLDEEELKRTQRKPSRGEGSGQKKPRAKPDKQPRDYQAPRVHKVDLTREVPIAKPAEEIQEQSNESSEEKPSPEPSQPEAQDEVPVRKESEEVPSQASDEPAEPEEEKSVEAEIVETEEEPIVA